MLDGLNQDLDPFLNIDAENMNAYGMPQDFDNPSRNGKPREAKFMKEITITEKASVIPNNADRKSRGVWREECLLNLTVLDVTLEKTYIKQQNDIEDHEKLCNRESCSEGQTADNVAISQEAGLGVLDVAEKAFDLNGGSTIVERHIHAGFSDHRLDSWEKGLHSSSPVVSDAKDNHEEVFSVLSLLRNGQTADKAVKRRYNHDYTSGKGQREEQLPFTMKDIRKEVSEKESIASKEDFSCSPDGKEAETEKIHCREEIGLSSESSESCASKRKSIKTKITAKPCYVLLKNSHERKEKHEYCLKPPNTKKLLPKTQNTAVFKKLQVALFNLLDKSYIKKLREPHKMQNAEALLENEKANKMESGLELNSSAKGLSSGGSDAREINADHDINKTESRPNSPDISALCDQGVFARFSFIESSNGNPIMNLCHVQKSEKGTHSLQIDSVVIPETQELKTNSPESTEMFVDYGNKLVKQAENEDIYHKIEEYQDLETITSRFSRKKAIYNTSQTSRVNLSFISHREPLQTNKINSACSSATSFSETKFSKPSIRRKDALHGEISHEGDICQASCEFDEPCFVFPVKTVNLNLDMENTIPSKTEVKMPTQRRIVSNPNTLAGKARENQLGVEQQETLSQSDSMYRSKNLDSCWFLLEIDEVIDEGVPVSVTDEEKKSRESECEDVLLDHGFGFPQTENKSTFPSLPGDVTVIKPSVIGKETMPSEHKEPSDVEGSVDPQSAPQNIPEEESLQLQQSQGVQIVFYELLGSVVKLLGTPSVNYETINLVKLTELEDSSIDKHKESQSSYASLSLNSKKGGKLHSVNKTFNLDSRTKKNRSQRPSKTPAPVYNSQLTQEESRIKVVDALRETFQKRLDDSPDLNVQKDTVSRIAKKVEKEIFKLFCCVDQHYKNKYRSLLFNLKSTENQHLFRRVILGEIIPKRLVQLSSLELAPKELAEWRAKENKRVLQVIEKEEREAPKCCSAKFTHKGIVEIQREANEGLSSLEESLSIKEGSPSCEISAAPVRDSRVKHWSHLRDSGYFSCSGQTAADNETGFKPPKRTLSQKANASKRLHQSTVYPEGGGRSLQEESTPKKHRWVEKQTKTSLIWKGLIQMFSVKQFVAEAYPVSGSSFHLCQGLPHLLQSRGCILPEDVWVYLDSMWPANSKEMGVIRFYPSLSKDFNPYNMLYSYLNNKQRYGIVDSNQMEIFVVPLASYQPVPSKLHPLGGPGLDPNHPSLLLGLILPKRTCTGTLESRPNPVPKAKRKRVTFKDSTETQYFALPLHSPDDLSQTGAPQPLSIDSLCGNEDPLMGLLRQKPLTIDALHNLTEELGRQMLYRDPSCLHQKNAEANQSLLGDTLQPLSDAPWTGGQLGNLTLEFLGAQPSQEGEQVQFCIESDPSHFWNTLGLLLPSESLCSQQHGSNGGGGDTSEAPFLSNVLCAETGLLSEVSQLLSSAQIPCTRCSPGEPNSLAEETLSLIQHVKQLQSHTQNQEPQLAATFSLPVMPQEITTALSQAVAGLEFPPVQFDGGTDAQIQLLLSILNGQTQSSSAV